VRALGLVLLLVSTSGGAAQTAATEPAVALDHVVLGTSDLLRGMQEFRDRGGAKPLIGGIHPDRGTWNALLSVGDRVYLEIVAPDPEAQRLDPMFRPLEKLKTLTPFLWLLRTSDADATVAKLRKAGYEVSDPQPGSRKTPDGKQLHWRTFALTSAVSTVAPHFIEWSKDSPHPATTSPGGCKLTAVEVADPKPEALQAVLDLLGVEIEVTRADAPSLGFALDCRRGSLRFP